ncbi:hypothetical protein [Nostoc sp.]
MPPIAALRSAVRSHIRTFRRHRLCLIPGQKPSDCPCLNQMVYEYIAI